MYITYNKTCHNKNLAHVLHNIIKMIKKWNVPITTFKKELCSICYIRLNFFIFIIEKYKKKLHFF